MADSAVIIEFPPHVVAAIFAVSLALVVLFLLVAVMSGERKK